MQGRIGSVKSILPCSFNETRTAWDVGVLQHMVIVALNKIFCVRTDILSSLAHMVNMRDSPTVWRQVSLLEMSSSDV